MSRPVFLTGVGSSADIGPACLLVDSLRTFGGRLANAEMWVFGPPEHADAARGIEDLGARIIPFEAPRRFAGWPYADKVAACAEAERLVPKGTSALIWIDPECLIVQPPLDFDLDTDHDVAFRPVHIRNVGLAPAAPLDAFWSGIYGAVGIDEVVRTVETFATGEPVRAYYNSHGFAVRPSLGLFGRWREHYERLITDPAFVRSACDDGVHRVFLFQALLSALIVAEVPEERTRLLPTTYNYPYNLHGRVPTGQRPVALNDLVCFTFEDRSIHPDEVTDAAVDEPLRTWLCDRLPRPTAP